MTLPTQWTHAGEVYTAPGGYTLTIVGSSVVLEHGDSLVDLTPEQAAELRRAAEEGGPSQWRRPDDLPEEDLMPCVVVCHNGARLLGLTLTWFAETGQWGAGDWAVHTESVVGWRRSPPLRLLPDWMLKHDEGGPVGDDWRRPDDLPTAPYTDAVLLVWADDDHETTERICAVWEEGWWRTGMDTRSAQSPTIIAWRPDTTPDPGWLTGIIPEVADA